MSQGPPGPVLFQNRVLRGSRLLSLVLTGMPDAALAHILTDLIAPHGAVEADGLVCMPRGTVLPQAARMGRADGLLPDAVAYALEQWWPGAPGGADVPDWDLACPARIAGRPGVVLVEAKAHAAELSTAGHTSRHEPHVRRLREAIREAGEALARVVPGWRLNADSHYPLASRFAWCWKLASLGVPVVVVYLGFLDAEDVADRGAPFHVGADWERTLYAHARGIVPDAAWNRRLEIGGTPLVPLVRTARLGWQVEAPSRSALPA